MERRARKRLSVKVAGAAMAVALVGAACSSETSSPTARTSPTAQATDVMDDNVASGVGTPAAQLVQGLTDLLNGHVYLAGIAVEQGVLTQSIESPQFTAAAEALDQNSQDLASAIESIYGADAGEQFLDLWRKHIGFFVDYTVGGITDDAKAQKKARSALDNYRADFGAFIDSATNGELPADAVADALQMHVNSLIATIDSVIDGKGNPFMKLYEAAHGHMPGTASALAGAIVAANPDLF